MKPLKRNGPPQDHNYLKKPKLKPSEYTPSKVLFMRGLAPTCTYKDILKLCSEFGVILHILFLSHKGQAFVELDSLEAASLCLAHFSKNPAYLGNNRLDFSYSGREQIETQEPSSSSDTLLLKVSEVKYPVTPEVLSEVFSPYGRILKSKIFPRKFGYQCLVKLDSTEKAVLAKTELEGKCIYSGCNYIQTEYSQVPLLLNRESESKDSNVVFLCNMGSGATPDMLFNLFSVYGKVQRVKVLFNRNDLGLVQFETHQEALKAKENLHNVPFCGKPLNVTISKSSYINMHENPAMCKEFGDSVLQRTREPVTPRAVLEFSNLIEGMDEDYFKALFEELESFKKLKKRSALVKFKSLSSAVTALVLYHNQSLQGSYLNISFSNANF